MTIPSVVMHNGQNMYVFESLLETENGTMAKFTSLYGGGGDFVLSRVPGHNWLADDLVEDFSSTSIIGSAVIQDEEVHSPAAVPEPSTALLLMGALVLVLCRSTAARLRLRSASIADPY
jgi:hypothetical protein